jgi:hypothetical protein
MDNSIFPHKNRFRSAGFFYLLHIVLTVYGVIFVSSKIGISGTEIMAIRILANEFLFRTGIISRLVGMIPTLFLAITLYQMLESINGFQAKLVLVTMVISIPFQFIAEVSNIIALMIAKGELLKSISYSQKHDFEVLFLNIYNNTVSIGQMFWGLWLFPFGLIALNSKFIPRIFGIFALLGSVGYLIDYLTFLLFPNYRSLTVYTLLFGFACEISIMFWMLTHKTKKNCPSLNNERISEVPFL